MSCLIVKRLFAFIYYNSWRQCVFYRNDTFTAFYVAKDFGLFYIIKNTPLQTLICFFAKIGRPRVQTAAPLPHAKPRSGGVLYSSHSFAQRMIMRPFSHSTGSQT